MKADTLKLVAVYSLVGFVVVYGMWAIVSASTHELPDSADRSGLVAVLGGFVGIALQFLTGSEIATRATKSNTEAFAAGAGTAPTITTSTPPTTTTVTPPAPTPPVAPEPVDG